MIIKYLVISMLVMAMSACGHHQHAGETHDEHKEHKKHKDIHDQSHHEDLKLQFSAYSDELELFAETDPFVVGETVNILSYFSTLPDFKAVDEGKVTITLSVGDGEISQTSEKPVRNGIYSFDLVPEIAGNGILKYEITNNNGSSELIVREITVFPDHEKAHEAAENNLSSNANTTIFPKEQAWKIDFASDFPKIEPFGRIIKTTALVRPALGGEREVTAKSTGTIQFADNHMFEGKEVRAGQLLFTVSGDGFAVNNISIIYAEAKSNFEKAKADYERLKELAKEKIVSEKDLLSAKNQYENAKAVFENLDKSTGEYGQSVYSPLSGFIKKVFVNNGAFVESGQAILLVSQDKELVLTAEVPQRFVSNLKTIFSANILNTNDKITYTLEQMNGKVLSYGKAVNSDNYLIPVNIQIYNNGSFIPGSFVEVYLKTLSNINALTVPVTALLEEQENYYVWVQINPELFEKREVHIGDTDGVSVEIKGGITAHERIVTKGAVSVKLAQATGKLDAHSGHVH